MLKLVFEPTITPSLWSIRYCSVNTETEPNLPIPNFLRTKFFLNRSVPFYEEPNLQWYRRTEPIGSVFTECPGWATCTVLFMLPWFVMYKELYYFASKMLVCKKCGQVLFKLSNILAEKIGMATWACQHILVWNQAGLKFRPRLDQLLDFKVLDFG